MDGGGTTQCIYIAHIHMWDMMVYIYVYVCVVFVYVAQAVCVYELTYAVEEAQHNA